MGGQPERSIAVLLRTSMTSEDAADILRTPITTQSVEPLAATIDAPDARRRAALAGATLMGIAIQLYMGLRRHSLRLWRFRSRTVRCRSGRRAVLDGSSWMSVWLSWRVQSMDGRPGTNV
jgi:hypothetical protein